MKPPKDKRKPETIIRELRRNLRDAIARADWAMHDLKVANGTKFEAWKARDEFYARATRAEQEAADWKRRFDALLAAIPELRAKAEPVDKSDDCKSDDCCVCSAEANEPPHASWCPAVQG